MKLLIVAHPDDEILWFNPQNFDKIIVCFGFDAKKHLNVTESNYYLDKSGYDKHIKNYKKIKELLKEDIGKADIIYTHNPWGEYCHPDHILVSQVVTELAKVPVFAWDGIMFNPKFGFLPISGREVHVEKIDLDYFRKVKEEYIKEGIWTWVKDYEPKPEQNYFQINSISSEGK